MNDAYYQGWSGSFIFATKPRRASDFIYDSDVSLYCATQFGPGYKVYEWHEAYWINNMTSANFCNNTWNWALATTGGWNVRAYAYLDACTRFWIHINDQPNGTCWKKKPLIGVPVPSKDE